MKAERLFWTACLLAVFSIENTHSTVPEDKIKSLYASLNETMSCGNTMLGIEVDFFRNIPAGERDGLVAEIIERAAKSPKDSPVIANVLQLVRPDDKGQMVLSERLESDILGQATNPTAQVREMVFDFLMRNYKAQYRSTVISGLEDSDERVRERSLDAIQRWPDAASICRTYIQTNQGKVEFHDSYIRAKAVVDPKDAARALEISGKWNAPHNVDYCDAYIAAHKGDPNYEISLDAAVRILNRAREDLSFYAKRSELPKVEDVLKTNPKVTSKYGALSIVDIDDWGNNWGSNGEEYGEFQLKVKGKLDSGVVRVAWHYQQAKFEITKIDEVASDDALHNLWKLETQ